MLDVKALLAKMLTIIKDKLSVASVTASVTTKTGVLNSISAYKYGNVVTIRIVCHNNSSVSSGSNLFTGTLNTTALKPVVPVTGGSYYGAHAITCSLSNTGDIVIRNASSTAVSITGTNFCTISLTYIVT